MNDYQLIRNLAAKLSCPVAWHVGSSGCKRCNGTGFIPIPFWRKMWAHYVEKLPWDCIRKEIWCMSCSGELVFDWPKKENFGGLANDQPTAAAQNTEAEHE